jgi:hypothetical protein
MTPHTPLPHLQAHEAAHTEPVFRFALGQQVRLARTGWAGTVVQQRLTVREVLGPVVEYLVQCATGTGWEYEPDVLPEEGAP